MKILKALKLILFRSVSGRERLAKKFSRKIFNDCISYLQAQLNY